MASIVASALLSLSLIIWYTGVRYELKFKEQQERSWQVNLNMYRAAKNSIIYMYIKHESPAFRGRPTMMEFEDEWYTQN